MCGRTACTLAPENICQACGHKGTDGRWMQPSWIDGPPGHTYHPSYNLAPTTFSPVLFSKKHIVSELCSDDVKSSELSTELVIQPMRWGLIPSWHRGDPSTIEYKMNNARSDGMLSKASFKKPLQQGRRCVVLADGYYEWHRMTEGKKQPYFIYFPEQNTSEGCGEQDVKQDVKVCISEQPADVDAKKSCDSQPCKRLLTMAGIFDIWKPHDHADPLYSYTVITVDAHEKLSWMHDRMPAILDGDSEIDAWLDYESLPLEKAVNLIRPTGNVVYHPVSPAVNNSRNNSEECIKAFNPESVQKKVSQSANMMMAWLKRPAKAESDNSKIAEKKLKTESH